MRTERLSNHGGGRVRLSLFYRPPFTTTNAPSRARFWPLISACLCLCGLPFASGQGRFPGYLLVAAVGQGGNNASPKNPPSPQDPKAIDLFQKMIHKITEAYRGIQETQVMEPSRSTSRQEIRGDRVGRIRRDFLEPSTLAGDVILICPRQYGYYHHLTNTTDIAFWSTEWNDQEMRLLRLIHRGRLSIIRDKDKTIAGRTAATIVLSASGPKREQMIYYIDTETNIQLGREQWSAGRLVRQTMITNITIGPKAGIKPRDFNVFNLAVGQKAQLNLLFPNLQFRTVQEAAGKLPFQPLESDMLPAGFYLTGVWPFGDNTRQPSVLLRYSNGVNDFSLNERWLRRGFKQPPAQPMPNSFRANHQRWMIALPDGSGMDITYIGHLSANQAGALYDSLLRAVGP